MSTLGNIVSNALRPGYAVEMLNKLRLRWQERGNNRERHAVRKWCIAQSVPVDAWARGLDDQLWEEARLFAAQQRDMASDKLARIGIDLGGGGAYDLIYFLTRLLRPQVIVETGVAAGFSSRAFLTALDANGGGTLLSSDFPYFRLADPERYVGYLVEPELRKEWTPLVKGDRTNLPQIAARAERIDLFHYDSDKSYDGRSFALRELERRFTPSTVVIFDDIQDNWHFRDFAAGKDHRVFAFEGKWVGMTGGPKAPYGQD